MPGRFTDACKNLTVFLTGIPYDPHHGSLFSSASRTIVQ
ncbi:Uncharacterised protein [Mycobacterium tuberculosis]|nr:Uncharacterised protein [Mycobacterium tuberculosis]